MYGISTLNSLPEACYTEQQAWDEIISEIWFSVLKPFCPKTVKTVVEIGPGTSGKVGLALSKLEFAGTIYVVDASKEAIATMKNKYKEYCPKANIIFLQGELKSCLPYLPLQPDLLLLSHVIDDLLMHAATQMLPEKNKIFDWCAHGSYALSPSELYQEVWQFLEKDDVTLQNAKKSVLALLMDLISIINPKCMVLSQYPSATLDENGLGSMNAHTHEIFLALHQKLCNQLWPLDQVQFLLNQNKNYNHEHIGNNILNGSN